MANTPFLGENQRLRLRLFPLDVDGKFVADPDNSQAVVNLADQTVRAELLNGGEAFAELRNADGTVLAPGGIVAPNRYGEVWLVGRPVRGNQTVRVRMTLSGDKVIGNSIATERDMIVTDTVPDVDPVDPPTIASANILTSGPVDVPDGWLK